MIDVDGSCLYKKHQQQGWVWSVDDDTIPDIPVEVNSSGEQHLKLKPTHIYYSQIQGQMAITERSWCDFVIYTEKGISVERIPFDAEFWNMFYSLCFSSSFLFNVVTLSSAILIRSIPWKW